MDDSRYKRAASGGWLNGMLGVVIFSGSLPATRLALRDFDPLFLTVARASIAGLLALAIVMLRRERWPQGVQWRSLVVVAIGVVVGFPLLTALALQHVTSAHSIVFIGLLPLATALFGVLRAGERPRTAFWVFSLIGSALVAGFALREGVSAAPMGDALMLLAIALCGLGYAEGGRLARTLGGWQVISWALVLSLPLMLLASLWWWPARLGAVSMPGWLSLAYVALFSMFLGFVFWYRGLAQGGIAAVGQLQLLQPLLGLVLAAALLHEQVSAAMLIVTLAVVLCVAGAKKFAS
ncbi:DMT family transporter [Comamonas fluminis]|uniref:DMT family transporter n=1 Tax=Comamonas fluminis TaxID=2796366 RepID=UPI001C467522|nr:DMT family transporter [Comamonas fluminis]